LAQALGLSRAALSNTLANLERAGWVTMKAHPSDGRRKRLALTAAGVETHKQCLRATRPELENLRAAIRGETAEAALPFLRSLLAWLTRS
jgi:DNA-binding MarR family transcriptional regulator